MRIIWRVQPKPTGRYRSFEERGWPDAHVVLAGTEYPVAMIQCPEDYNPAKVKAAIHPPLRVLIRDYRDGSPTHYQSLKVRALSMEMAKTLVKDFYLRNPSWLPQLPPPPPLTREQKLAGAIQAALDEDVIKTASWRQHLIDLLKEPS